MMYRLIILTGPRSGERVNIEKAPMTFGRDAVCSVVLDDEEVALRHAVLEHRPDGLFIRDLGSMNRILVNKREVRESRVKHGDVVELGLTRLLVQALVQAEVQEAESDEGAAARRRKLIRVSAAAAAVLLAGLALQLLRDARQRREVASVTPPPVMPLLSASSNAPPAAVPPLAAVSEALPANAPVSDEIRAMREELSVIRDAVKGLAVREGAPDLQPVPAAAVQELSGSEKMLLDAQGLMDAGRYVEAENLLNSLLIVDPGFLPAFEERAVLFERQGLLKKAMEQWSEIARRAGGTATYDRALGERLRLAERERQFSAGPRMVRIASVEPQKFMATDEYDEMRVLKVSLRPDDPERAVDPAAVRVEVKFYEQDAASGQVLPVPGGGAGLAVNGNAAWTGSQQRNVTAPYVVPKGTREASAQEGRALEYYGYRVSVFYHDALQDEYARPKTLLVEDAATASVAPAAGSADAAGHAGAETNQPEAVAQDNAS